MRKIILLVVVLAMSSFALPLKGTLTDSERQFAINYLTKTRNDLLKVTKGLSDAQLKFKAAPDRWSIAECIEHIAIAETGIFKMIMGALQQPANPSKRSEVKLDENQLIKEVTDRTQKLKAPEFLQPSNKFATSAAALASFEEQRNATINYVRSTQDELHDHFSVHPVYGTLDEYEFIILIAGHEKRHTLQIAEVKADKNFPK
jgi:hypothetical protein